VGVRVAITGMGLVTPLGTGVEEVWDGLVHGRSGVGAISHFDATGFPTRIAGEVPDFEPELYMDRKTARHAARYCQLALAAARMAVDDSGLKPESLDADAVGVVVSSAAGGMEEIEKALRDAAECSACRGFAIGRTIFEGPARKWLQGEIDDPELVSQVREAFLHMIDAWRVSRKAAPGRQSGETGR